MEDCGSKRVGGLRTEDSLLPFESSKIANSEERKKRLSAWYRLCQPDTAIENIRGATFISDANYFDATMLEFCGI